MTGAAPAADARRFQTIQRRLMVRKLRDEQHLTWAAIAERIGTGVQNARDLYRHSIRKETK